MPVVYVTSREYGMLSGGRKRRGANAWRRRPNLAHRPKKSRNVKAK
jgi:hypothetical protein